MQNNAKCKSTEQILKDFDTHHTHKSTIKDTLFALDGDKIDPVSCLLSPLPFIPIRPHKYRDFPIMLYTWIVTITILFAIACWQPCSGQKVVTPLRDYTVQGDSLIYLDNRFNERGQNRQWRASNSEHFLGATTTTGGENLASSSSQSSLGIDIPAMVPGDLITDLVTSHIIGDPLYELNFKNSSLWENHTWTYSTAFTVPPPNDIVLHDDDNHDAKQDAFLLVLEGIKMGARIELNGDQLGVVQNQFLRYTFQLSLAELSENKNNELAVIFDPTIPVAGRFMACTGGWDWAPYSDTQTSDTNARTFSKGIWKSVYVVQVSSVAIMSVVPQIKYKGAYPVEPMVDGNHSGFDVVVRVRLLSPAVSSRGTIVVKGNWGVESSTGVIEIPPNKETMVEVKITAMADSIKLWWPVGVSPNPTPEATKAVRALYNITVSYEPTESPEKVVTATRTIGFRHFALVTGNDTDPEYIRDSADKEGTSSMGFWWRVNGVPMWSRGANMIPMDELEGRLSAEAHIQLVRSAVDGNMNTLRIWGGGMFLPKIFYDTCDRLGILVYHDMMYAQGGHYPQATQIQDAELRDNIRRLSSHPSIVMWDACNECHYGNDDTTIYSKFVMRVVAEEDSSRVVWPSSPAKGWESGVERLTSLPTGSALETPNKNQKRRDIETHGSYARSTGFPTVNGRKTLPRFPPYIPLKIKPDESRMGIGEKSVFASEFGAVVMSSFESMTATLDPSHWSIHGGAPPDTCSNEQCKGGNVMAERNYNCDYIIEAYFETEPGYYDGIGEEWFKRQLYHCMLGSALHMKGDIETRRSRNELGHLVWQLNEIWPTGGWGSLEYGNPSYPGQIVGGRWKPLHYFYKASVFADVMATCGLGGLCYIRNDAFHPFRGHMKIRSINIKTGIADWDKSFKNLTLAPGPGSLKAFQIPSKIQAVDGCTHFLIIDVHCHDGLLSSTNVLLLEPPKNIKNLPFSSDISFSIGDVAPDGAVPIEVKANVPVALFVILTTEAPGRFSNNAFPIIGAPELVHFMPFKEVVDIDLLQKTLRVEDLAQYVHPPNTRINDLSSRPKRRLEIDTFVGTKGIFHPNEVLFKVCWNSTYLIGFSFVAAISVLYIGTKVVQSYKI